ncbi:MAG TPA: YbjN domain-containing protein [Candidatus Angelobacter sp.]|nr:YbjN domain-containing protein [Candidatus Angelobacter sp.]
MKNLTNVLLLFLVFSAPALSQECISKVQGFVDKTGYTITLVKPCKAWVAADALAIPKGDGLSGLLLIAQEDESGLVGIGTVVQSKAKLNLSADLLLKLMRLNDELDFVKVGIDRDGDLFVRTELRMASLTAEDFSATVKSVVQASTRVYALVKK